jgi:hypothetical protein
VSVGGAFALQWIRSTRNCGWSVPTNSSTAPNGGRNCVHIEEQPDSTVSAEEKACYLGL